MHGCHAVHARSFNQSCSSGDNRCPTRLRSKQFWKKSRMQPLYYKCHFEIDKSRQDKSAGSCTLSSSSIGMLGALWSRPTPPSVKTVQSETTIAYAQTSKNSELNFQNDPVFNDESRADRHSKKFRKKFPRPHFVLPRNTRPPTLKAIQQFAAPFNGHPPCGTCRIA